MSHLQTLQQKRAASAWEAIEVIDREYSPLASKYGSLVRGLPAMIQTDGIGHTMAFLLAKAGKNNNEHAMVYSHVSQWVCAQMNVPEAHDLMQWLMRQNSLVYRRATSEALAYLQWMKRFVEAKGWQSQED